MELSFFEGDNSYHISFLSVLSASSLIVKFKDVIACLMLPTVGLLFDQMLSLTVHNLANLYAKHVLSWYNIGIAAELWCNVYIRISHVLG